MKHPHPKSKKVVLRLNAYALVSDALEHGLGFALNRLEDVTGDYFDDAIRGAAIEPMKNELLLALEEIVDWDKSK